MTHRPTRRLLWLTAWLPLAACSTHSVECLTLDLESGLAWRSRAQSWRLLGVAEPVSCAPPALPPPADGPPSLPPPPGSPGTAPMRS
ncbi:hypothetical protein ACVFYP_17815 [Roseomonas sp. F4]